MEKIKMTTPLVEMDGDEMTRVLCILTWKVNIMIWDWSTGMRPMIR